MGMRECPFCGKKVNDSLVLCSFCRETLPEKPRHSRSTPGVTTSDAGHRIRRGLLYMFLAAVIGYFASGSSPLKLPVSVPSAVTHYLVPVLFVCGLALSLYGFYQSHLAPS